MGLSIFAAEALPLTTIFQFGYTCRSNEMESSALETGILSAQTTVPLTLVAKVIYDHVVNVSVIRACN